MDVDREEFVVERKERGLSHYVGLFVLVVTAFFTVVAIYTLWPWIRQISIGFLCLGLLAGLIFFALYLMERVVAINAKRNRSMVIHEDERGLVYRNGDSVMGYTHPINGVDYEALDEEGEGPTIPQTFGEMVEQGDVQPGGPYVVAYAEDGEPIQMKKLTSLGIGGGQGFGKTVTTLSLMAQTVAKNEGDVRFIVVDPHMEVDGDESLMAMIAPLSPFFLTIEDVRSTVDPGDHDYLALLNRAGRLSNPVAGGESLSTWMKIVRMEMERRLHGKKGGLWVIVMDEFAALMSSPQGKDVALIIEAINQQARKMGMFSLLISQEWKASRTGGSELRHSVVSFIAHNMPVAISELVLPGDAARQTPTLGIGEVIVYNKGETKRGHVPLATKEDAAALVEQYQPRRVIQISEVRSEAVPVEGRWKDANLAVPSVGDRFDIPELPPARQTSAIPVDFAETELRQTRRLYVEGLTEADIAKEVFSVTRGPELAKAKIKVRSMLAWMVEQGYSG